MLTTLTSVSRNLLHCSKARTLLSPREREEGYKTPSFLRRLSCQHGFSVEARVCKRGRGRGSPPVSNISSRRLIYQVEKLHHRAPLSEGEKEKGGG